MRRSHRGLSAALGAFARVADDFDDVLGQRDRRLGGRKCVRFRLPAWRFEDGDVVHVGPLEQRARTRAKLRSLCAMPKTSAVVVRRRIVANAEIGFHAAGGFAPGAHRFDHRCRARDDVAAGVDAAMDVARFSSVEM